MRDPCEHLVLIVTDEFDWTPSFTGESKSISFSMTGVMLLYCRDCGHEWRYSPGEWRVGKTSWLKESNRTLIYKDGEGLHDNANRYA